MATLQIRNVPEAVRRRLNAKAALEGISLSDLLLRGALAEAETPSVDELRAPDGLAAGDDRPQRGPGCARRARRWLIAPGASAAIGVLLRRCGWRWWGSGGVQRGGLALLSPDSSVSPDCG